MKISWRSFGGLAGAVAAVAGGIGAAVGFYSVPDPTTTAVGQNVYVRADEHAIAVWTRDNGDGTRTEVRIDTGRGGSAGATASAGARGFPSAAGEQRAGVHFTAMMQTCNEAGECYDFVFYEAEEWMPMTLEIDPLLQRATFSGLLHECQFDVTWTGTGEVAPFVGAPNSDGSIGIRGANARVDNGFAETSRVAPADIQTCFGSFQDANGYLSRGIRRTIASADAQFGG